MSNRSKSLEVLAVCGLGMGTSLILRMTVESVLKKLNIAANVANTDLSTAQGMQVDVLVGQSMHVEELTQIATIVVTVEDFVDEEAFEAKLVPALQKQGWI